MDRMRDRVRPLWRHTARAGLFVLLFAILAGAVLPGRGVGYAAGPEASPAADAVRLVIDGKPVTPDVPPRIVNGRTLVPIRIISETLGAAVEWSEAERLVTVSQRSVRVQLKIDDTRATINGEPALLDVPPTIVDGRTLVPLRFVAEALGLKVEWEGATRTVRVGPVTVTAIRYETPDGVPRLRVSGDGPLRYAISYDGARRVTVDVLHAVAGPDVPTGSFGVPGRIDVGGGYIERVLVEAIPGAPRILRLQLELAQPLEPLATYIENEFLVGFAAELQEVAWTQADGAQRLLVYTNIPVRWTFEMQPDGRRAFVDLPNVKNRLQRPLPGASGLLAGTSIGPGMLPSWTRLTVDLSEVATGKTVSTGIPRIAGVDFRSVAPPPSIFKRKVFLDPGHGGSERGARGPSGVEEKGVNLAITLKLRDLLQRAGYEVLMSRTRDANVDLYERPRFANDAGADIFVSVHNNAFVDPRVGGTEVYHYNGFVGSRRLAESIMRGLARGVGLTDRGIRNNQAFVVIKETKMPSVLVEVAYLTNPDEERLLTSEAFQQRVATALFNGIQSYFSGEPVAR